jgi:hypothetical protein
MRYELLTKNKMKILRVWGGGKRKIPQYFHILRSSPIDIVGGNTNCFLALKFLIFWVAVFYTHRLATIPFSIFSVLK